MSDNPNPFLPKIISTKLINETSFILKPGDIFKAAKKCKTPQVFVNSTNSKLDLSKGLLSGKLLRCAGSDVQRQLNEKLVDNKFSDSVAITNGGDLKNVTLIFHVVLKKKNTVQIIKTAIREILKECHKRNIKTLSLPILGCGLYLSCDANEVTSIYINEILNYTSYKLETINLIVYLDKSNYKVYQDAENVIISNIIQSRKQMFNNFTKSLQIDTSVLKCFTQKLQKSTLTNNKNKLILLDPESDEYYLVIGEVIMKAKRIIRELSLEDVIIYRVENQNWWTDHETYRGAFSKDGEQLLWHGTTANNSRLIADTKFNISKASTNAGECYYGQGIYFHKYMTYPAIKDWITKRDENDYKYVFLVNVVHGKTTLGQPNMTSPPNGFLSTCCKHEKEFVIYEPNATYPLYLIQFKCQSSTKKK